MIKNAPLVNLSSLWVGSLFGHKKNINFAFSCEAVDCQVWSIIALFSKEAGKKIPQTHLNSCSLAQKNYQKLHF